MQMIACELIMMWSEGSCLESSIVVCGGPGTRLQPLTRDTPKHLLPIAGRPLLSRILAQLVATEITVVAGHLADGMRRFLANSPVPVRVVADAELVGEPIRLGPWGAVAAVASKLRGRFAIVWIGDVYCEVDVERLIGVHLQRGDDLTACVAPSATPSVRGIFGTRGDWATSYREGFAQSGDLVNVGVYVVGHRGLECLDSLRGRWLAEDVVFPFFFERGLRVGLHHIHGYHRNINTPTDLLHAHVALMQTAGRPFQYADSVLIMPNAGSIEASGMKFCIIAPECSGRSNAAFRLFTKSGEQALDAEAFMDLIAKAGGA